MNVKTIVEDATTKNAYWIYSSFGDTIPMKVLNYDSDEYTLSENTQIYVDDSSFIVVSVRYDNVPSNEGHYETGKQFLISAGFKSNGAWVQDYISAELHLNLKTGFMECHLDTIEILNGSSLRVEYTIILYTHPSKVTLRKTIVILGAQGFFDKKEKRNLTSRRSLENNFYISNSTRPLRYELEEWDEKMIRESIRSDSIWVEKCK